MFADVSQVHNGEWRQRLAAWGPKALLVVLVIGVAAARALPSSVRMLSPFLPPPLGMHFRFAKHCRLLDLAVKQVYPNLYSSYAVVPTLRVIL